jgi:hypothetical protein
MRHREKYRYICPNHDAYPTHHNFYWHVPLIVQIINGGAQASCPDCKARLCSIRRM